MKMDGSFLRRLGWCPFVLEMRRVIVAYLSLDMNEYCCPKEACPLQHAMERHLESGEETFMFHEEELIVQCALWRTF